MTTQFATFNEILVLHQVPADHNTNNYLTNLAQKLEETIGSGAGNTLSSLGITTRPAGRIPTSPIGLLFLDLNSLHTSLSSVLQTTQNRKVATSKLSEAYKQMKDQVQRIQMLVYHSASYCEHCKTTKQELIDLKKLVDELVDIKEKMSKTHEQTELLAVGTDDILADNMRLQESAVNQLTQMKHSFESSYLPMVSSQ